MTTATKTRHTLFVRVQAFDINEIVRDRNDNPETLVDVIVPVKTTSKNRAEKLALARTQRIIKAGWTREEYRLLGRWTTRISRIKNIRNA
jgi:hypothetical protein